jgi:GR25 family glycosyltransferase involved in LPS biosynthesis
MVYNKAYYITVNEFKDRQKLMELQFEKYNLNVTKFVGINKNKIDFNKLIQSKLLYNKNSIHPNKIGTLACCLSHLFLYIKIYKENKDNDKEVFLIFEDDCIISPQFDERLEQMYKYVPDNWDMIWLGWKRFLGKVINKYVGIPKNKPGLGYNSQHHCYLIKKSSIPKFIKLLTPVDFLYNSKTKDNHIRNNFDKFNAYFLSERLAFQNMNIKSMRTGGNNG